MKRNQLGKSDIYVSELTLGCMSLGQDKNKAKEIIDTALAQGINHLDTADLYDFGLNEEIIGEIIKDRRQDIILTTKAGNHFSKETKDWFWDPSKGYIVQAAKESLKRLQTDYIDFFMLHGGTLDDPIEETIEAMEELKQDGLIRAYGISSIRPNVIDTFINKSSIDGVMLQYNLLDRRPEESVLKQLESNQISAIVRGPLAKGMLSTYYKENITKKAAKGFLDYNQTELLETAEAIAELAGGMPMNELALKYVLQHPAVTTITFGASTKEQVMENTAADLTADLPEDLYVKLKEHTKRNIYEQHRV
ncbi:aldo/keto reductase [Oceanobacillus alkalisoli]|uniref:aldo/keto reductase n=1 Tax=Oceanobacillus alkalisoli TaxID=2925113 RepID=UPI001EE46981|nr:aldo/keto reductase [Oceanobacillus alkalisoli]MCG5102983.1 aldo/keto reductase [Oceanobacillus alkalisoli]